MEFLMGNPFSTPVGQRIERATSSSLPSEDWALNMEVCDMINSSEEGPKDAVRAIRKRIAGNKNFKEVMLALTVSTSEPDDALSQKINISSQQRPR
uniref:VHS domain-containing protein n=1 Tax=Monopterus albus TaxID=43700 RepID=A0A3Q3Q716_MONAL